MTFIETIINLIVDKIPDYRLVATTELVEKIKRAISGTEFSINEEIFITRSVLHEPDGTISVLFDNNQLSLKGSTIYFVKVLRRPRGRTHKPMRVDHIE